MNCLAVDVGNTSTALGVLSGKRVLRVAHVRGGIGDIDAAEDALQRLLSGRQVGGAILASVVPNDNRRWSKLIRAHVGTSPFVVTHKAELGVAISYPEPASIGADRLANAVAAVSHYGAPVIVADFGTALTFDVVAEGPTYVGGVIAPGVPLMTEYLADRTALLPLIRLKGRCGKVGKSTEGAMRIGAHVGYRGMVREIVEHLTKGLGSESVALCATGGFAKWILADADMPFVVEPNLTLMGLRRLFELNCAIDPR
jgi:type III pantothenate kinase